MKKVIIIDSKDNVATSITQLAPNTIILAEVNSKILKIKIHEHIKYGHKIAIKPIKKGSLIIKYGEVIGRATTNISSGRLVHIKNIESLRGGGDLNGR